MKMNKVVLAVLASLIAFGVSASESVEVTPNSEVASELDGLRGEIDLWTEKGRLQGMKRATLSDEVQVLELEREVNRLRGHGSGPMLTDSNGVILPVDDYFGYSRSLAERVSAAGNAQQQSALASTASVRGGEDVYGHSAPDEVDSSAMKELQMQQESFFKQVQDFLSESGLKSGEESGDDFVFEDGLDFTSFSARIASRTKSNIELAFAASVGQLDPGYLMENISPDTEEFNLHFFGLRSLPVKVLEVTDTSVKLDVDGNIIIAR